MGLNSRSSGIWGRDVVEGFRRIPGEGHPTSGGDRIIRAVGQQLVSLRFWKTLRAFRQLGADVPDLIEIPQGHRILVLAPHMDDEVIGCGGTMVKHADRGCAITVAILTDGSLGDPVAEATPMSPEARTEVRRCARPMSELVAWRRTKAYAVSHGGINVNLKGREPCGVVHPGAEFEAVLQRVVEELLRLEDPETGQRVVENVLRKEELFEGPFVGEAPDLYFFFKKDFTCFPTLEVGGKDLFRRPSENHNLSAHHLASLEAQRGVLFMEGPTVSRGAALRNARLLDMAPTILYLLGLPIPDYMDGRVLEGAIVPERLAAHPPVRVRADASPGTRRPVAHPEDEEGQIRAQLKGLGYLG